MSTTGRLTLADFTDLESDGQLQAAVDAVVASRLPEHRQLVDDAIEAMAAAITAIDSLEQFLPNLRCELKGGNRKNVQVKSHIIQFDMIMAAKLRLALVRLKAGREHYLQ